MGEQVQQQDIAIMRMSEFPRAEASQWLKAYADQVYFAAFPEPDLRENPPDWVQYLDGTIPSPAPWTEVILLVQGEAVLGGVTIEYYRQAGAGLLTYIAIDPQHRGRTLTPGGKKLSHILVEEARTALANRGGSGTLMFAETERFEDAHDEEERAATLVRQRQLTKLGAREIGFEYVMPPLRADAAPRRLHLLLLDPPSPGQQPMVRGALVLALLDELARSLGTELSAHPDTAQMEKALRADISLPVSTLRAVHYDELFRETAVFGDVAAASFSFAFELRYQHVNDCPVKGSALLVSRIAEDLHQDSLVHDALVEPTRSFLDDVTTGPPGHNGRPLLFLASPRPFDDPSRRVRMIRPQRWLYKAEDNRRELQSATPPINLVLQDSFCAFESGKLFYVMTLVLDPDSGQAIDEYAIIQLQNLAMKPDDDEQVRQHGDIAFAWRPDGTPQTDPPHDLWELAEQRLQWLERGREVERPRAVKDIIARFEIQPKDSTRAPILPGDLKNLCVSVENEAIISAAEAANAMFGHDGKGNGDLSMLEDDSYAAPFATIPAQPLPHHDPANRIDRSMLALAGLATGVPDFPWQDTSEVHDSTRPAAVSVDAVMYVHPRFTLEVAREWRSFQHSLSTLGNCPYLLLMWLASLHDELIVETIEQGINEMVYGPVASGPKYRIMAMADVDLIRRQSRRMLGSSGNQLLERNLQRRLDLFRFSAIHRSGKIFRYPKEKGALEKLLEEKGITQRFDRAEKLIDRIEGLVEDVATVKSAFAERRTNLVLSTIAIFSMIGISSSLAETYVDLGYRPLFIGLATTGFIAAVFLYLFWSDLRQSRRD